MAEEEGDLSMAAAPTFRAAVQKPKFGIYYALLIIALCAMLIGCGVLYKFIRDFGGFGTVKGKIASTQSASPFLTIVSTENMVELI